jgi:hypothetical protein
LGARDNLPFFSSRHHERDIAAAVKRRVGQRNARLGFRTDNSDHPPSRLLQRRLTGKQ